MRESRWFVVAAILAVTVACASPEPPVESGETDRGFVEQALTDPDRMQVEPGRAAPGDTVSVRFPEGDPRGPGFVLERKSADSWVWEWAVHSDPDGETQNVWSAEEFRARDVEWNAGPGFDGTDLHVVPIPEGSQPGTYRVCTAPTSPALCVELEVEEPTAGPAPGGSDGGEAAAARKKWAASRIADYTLEFVGGGCDMNLAGQFDIEVAEERVVEVVRHGLDGGPQVISTELGVTVEGLFDIVNEARADADEVMVTYDEALGFPRAFDVVWEEDATDGTCRYEVVSLVPHPTPDD